MSPDNATIGPGTRRACFVTVSLLRRQPLLEARKGLANNAVNYEYLTEKAGKRER